MSAGYMAVYFADKPSRRWAICNRFGVPLDTELRHSLVSSAMRRVDELNATARFQRP